MLLHGRICSKTLRLWLLAKWHMLAAHQARSTARKKLP